jgi:hypothetical protein
MNPAVFDKAEKIAKAVLYEGYMLYPYRASSTKNRQRCPFGTLFPAQHPDVARGAEKYRNQTQCLLSGTEDTNITVRVRFLQICGTDGNEAVERTVDAEVKLAELLNCSRTVDFEFPVAFEPSREAVPSPISGQIQVSAEPLRKPGFFRLKVEVLNLTPFRPEKNETPVLLLSFASVHTVLGLRDGEFVSQIDPPDDLREASAECKNIGAYPVLVGEPGEHDVMLSSPIILYDYPQVAPESAGDFFDATEIDELLTLRIMTLTDDEKSQMRKGDERLRELLERTEATAREQLARTHGAVRSLRPIKNEAKHQQSQKTEFGVTDWNPLETTPADSVSVSSVHICGVEVRAGHRVRLWPRKSADIMDIALKGKVAIIEAIETDYENNVHIAVVLEDDPGREFGMLRQPGHRFFFSPEEVEPVATERETKRGA